MRRRKSFAVIAAGIGLAVALIFFIGSSSPFAPNISITPTKYERSRWHDNIDVQIAITNTGVVLLRPEDSNVFDPDAFVRVELPRGWTNVAMKTSLLPLNYMLLQPGYGMKVGLSLPGDAQRWQVGYQVRSARPEISAVYWTSRWGTNVTAVAQRMTANKRAVSRLVWSDIFDVPTNIEFDPLAF